MNISLKFTGFDSWTPFKFKQNFVTKMLFRANRICSKVEFYDEEKKNLLNMLCSSGYRKNLAIKLLENAQYRLTKPKFHGPLQKPIYFGLSFFGNYSKQFENNVRSSFRKLQIPGSKLVFYYKKQRNLMDLFSKNYKNLGYDNGKSGVYKISCNNCDLSYIGQTGRPFTVRLNEHKHFHGPLGKYATFDHSISSNNLLHFDYSDLIWPDYRENHRKIIESLMMQSHKCFDNNISSKKLNVF